MTPPSGDRAGARWRIPARPGRRLRRPGHVFPAISLGRALAGRGHEVVVETWEERRAAVEGAGLGFAAAEEYRMFPPPEPDSADGQHAAEAARALLPLLEEMRPHVAVSDILTLAPALAAERAGVPLATLIPHIYPVVEPGLPFFAIGLRPPRTPLGRAVWRAGQRALDVGLEHGRRDLNLQRQRLGLPPIERFHGGISPDLALVATYPPARVPAPLAGRGRGDRADDLRAAPPGDRAAAGRARRWSWSPPAPPTTPSNHLVRTALAALADEPVRVVATTNRVVPQRPIEVPANAVLVDWLSYSQLMPAASLVDLPRRPRHRRPRPRRRHPGPDLPDHRRHERDRDAGRLGRGRPLAALAAVPAGAAALGGAARCSASPPSPPAPARSPPGGGRTTAPSAAPSWSSALARDKARATPAPMKLRGWDSNPQPFD